MNNENNQSPLPNGGLQNQQQPTQPVTSATTDAAPIVTTQVNNSNESQASESTPVTAVQTSSSQTQVAEQKSVQQSSVDVQPVVQQTPVVEQQSVGVATTPSQPQSFEMPNINQNTSTFSGQVQNQAAPNVQTQQPVATAPIINTDAAKAKANELAAKAKTGFSSYTEKLKTDKKVLIISIIVVLAILFCLGTYMQTGGSKGVVKTYASAMVKYDAKKMTKIFHEDYIDYMEDLTDEDFEDTFEETFERFEKRDYKILKYKIIDYEKYDKDQIEDYAEKLEKSYDINEKDVKDVVEYSIKFTIDNDGDKEIERTEVNAVKIKNKWYIFE